MRGEPLPPMMKAYVLRAPTVMSLEERPTTRVGDGDVLVRVRRAGICGSDLHYYARGWTGEFVHVPCAPFVLGHEFCGEVAAAGSAVRSVREGDRVSVEATLPCGTCPSCRCGRYNLCGSMRFLGSAGSDPQWTGVLPNTCWRPRSTAIPWRPRSPTRRAR